MLLDFVMLNYTDFTVYFIKYRVLSQHLEDSLSVSEKTG